jgi:hypothetical protein
MSLHVALHATNLVLQTPPRMLERIIDRRINVSVAPVGIRLVPNIDLLFIRQSDADMDLEKTASPVVLPWTFQHHATACNPAVSFLERRNVPRNVPAQPLLRFHALKLDMHWGFHLGSTVARNRACSPQIKSQNVTNARPAI